MNTLGISGVLGHDAAACLLRGGELIAFVEEERFTRQKHAPGSFPLNATAYCLSAAGLQPHDVDVIATSWDPDLDPSSPYLATWLPQFLAHPMWRRHKPRQVAIAHHLAHAAAAAYFEGVDDAAVLVIDGNGERSATTLGKFDASGFHLFEEYPVTQSLGHFYTRAAFYLGLGQHGEGRLMGLAGYGQVIDSIEPISIDGNGYSVNLSTREAGPTLDRLRSLATAWDGWLRQQFGPPEQVSWTWDEDQWRIRGEAATVLARANVAASVQQKLLEAVVQLARRATALAGSRRLILAGGVALNGGANDAILAQGAADELVFFPACHDAGAALGAAAWAARAEGYHWSKPTSGPYLGPSATDEELRSLLDRSGLAYTRIDDIATEVAQRIGQNRVVARCAGGMEAGPRALGNRSILARVDDPEVGARVNRIKLREGWRPFGPSLPVEEAGSFFERSTPSPYMLEFRAVRADARSALAAVTHIDGTTRPQTVSAEQNPVFHELIAAVGTTTGVPAVINTSFNVGPEPIVCSPADALRTFVSSDLDDLVLGDVLISKRC